MPHVRPITGFLCRFVIVFALLVAPWPGWKQVYARFLRNSASTLLGSYGPNGIHSTIHPDANTSVSVDFGSFGSKAIVAFAPNPMADKAHDTIVYVANRRQAEAGGEWSVKSCAFNSRYLAFLPTALMIALILATEVGWLRRLGALLWGLVWVHVFISFQLGLMILVKLCANPQISQFQVSPFWQRIVSLFYECFVEHIGTNLAAVVPIWILVTFRRDDWVKLLGKEGAAGKTAQTVTGRSSTR
jgi:hypothetical protein